MGSAGEGASFFSNDSHANDLEYLVYDSQALLVPDRALASARRLVNAYDFRDRCNPHQHGDGWLPVGPDLVLVVVLGERGVRIRRSLHPFGDEDVFAEQGEWITVRCWRIVKCARERRRGGRALSTLMGRVTSSGRTYDYLEPLEYLDQNWWEDVDDDEVVDIARDWQQELKQTWSLESAEPDPAADVVLPPDRITWLLEQRGVNYATVEAEAIARVERDAVFAALKADPASRIQLGWTSTEIPDLEEVEEPEFLRQEAEALHDLLLSEASLG